MSARGTHTTLISEVESHPLLDAQGVIWRSGRFGPWSGQSHVWEGPGGPLIAVLPEDMQNAVSKRRGEFLAGRICAGLALRSLGMAPKVGRKGRAPVWPRGIAGSISHTGDLAVAVVSRDHGSLGLDCEMVFSSHIVRDVAPLILSAQDRAWRSVFHSEERFVTLVFSAKEALYKSLSAELPEIPDFTDAAIVALDDRSCTLRLGHWTVPVFYAFAGPLCVTLAALNQ